MTQISRVPLPKVLEQQMHTAFRQALADLRTEEEVDVFLDDLLTPTEKIMLGKRLAIAILLDRGYDQRTVHSIMKVSLGTVNTVNFWLKNRGKGYRAVIEKMKTRKEWIKTKTELEKFLKDFFSQHRKLHPRSIREVYPQAEL